MSTISTLRALTQRTQLYPDAHLIIQQTLDGLDAAGRDGRVSVPTFQGYVNLKLLYTGVTTDIVGALDAAVADGHRNIFLPDADYTATLESGAFSPPSGGFRLFSNSERARILANALGGVDNGAIDIAVTDVVLEGFEIFHDYDPTEYDTDTYLGQSITMASGAGRVTIRHLVFREVPRQAIFAKAGAADGYSNIEIDRCQFYDIGRACCNIQRAKYCKITDNHTRGTGDDGFALTRNESEHSLVDRNTFIDIGTTGQSGAAVKLHGNFNIVSRNISKNSYRGICTLLQLDEEEPVPTGNIIIGNTNNGIAPYREAGGTGRSGLHIVNGQKNLVAWNNFDCETSATGSGDAGMIIRDIDNTVEDNQIANAVDGMSLGLLSGLTRIGVNQIQCTRRMFDIASSVEGAELEIVGVRGSATATGGAFFVAGTSVGPMDRLSVRDCEADGIINSSFVILNNNNVDELEIVRNKRLGVPYANYSGSGTIGSYRRLPIATHIADVAGTPSGTDAAIIADLQTAVAALIDALEAARIDPGA